MWVFAVGNSDLLIINIQNILLNRVTCLHVMCTFVNLIFIPTSNVSLCSNLFHKFTYIKKIILLEKRPLFLFQREQIGKLFIDALKL